MAIPAFYNPDPVWGNLTYPFQAISYDNSSFIKVLNYYFAEKRILADIPQPLLFVISRDDVCVLLLLLLLVMLLEIGERGCEGVGVLKIS